MHYCVQLSSYQLVQLHLRGVSNCKQWKNIGTSAKITAFSIELIMYIRNQCACDSQTLTFNQSSFNCFDDSPNYITFRTVTITPLNVDVVEIVENWVLFHTSVTILGDTLNVDSNCPILISTFDDPECSSSMANVSSTYIIIIVGSASGILFAVIVMTLLLSAVCFTAYRKHKRYVVTIKFYLPFYFPPSNNSISQP